MKQKTAETFSKFLIKNCLIHYQEKQKYYCKTNLMILVIAYIHLSSMLRRFEWTEVWANYFQSIGNFSSILYWWVFAAINPFRIQSISGWLQKMHYCIVFHAHIGVMVCITIIHVLIICLQVIGVLILGFRPFCHKLFYS